MPGCAVPSARQRDGPADFSEMLHVKKTIAFIPPDSFSGVLENIRARMHSLPHNLFLILK